MVKKVKVKGILRFYFSADGLERAFENLIMKKACAPFADGLKNAERITEIIEEKTELENLWAYINSVMSGFSEEERGRLREYAARRSKQCICGEKAVKSAVIKFVRRARRIEEFGKSIEVLRSYYCLMC